jgi:DNA-binding beta-propeller fold protein YncE
VFEVMRLNARGSGWRLALAMACVTSVLAMSAYLRAFQATPSNPDPQYLSPGEIEVSADGRFLFVVCERSDELRVVDTRSGLVVRSIAVGPLALRTLSTATLLLESR